MNSSSSRPRREERPPSNADAAGCLFLSGCLGGIAPTFLASLALLQIVIVVYSWATHSEVSWIAFTPGLHVWAFWIISAFGYQGLRSRKREPWIYWVVVLCLLGWCWFAFTTQSVKIGPSQYGEAKAARIGSWVLFTICTVVLVRFATDRENLHYFRILKPKARADEPEVR